MQWPSFYVWLLPDAAAQARYADVIVELSRRLRGPRFDPHITLGGPLEGSMEQLRAETLSLAAALPPVALEWESIDSSPAFFRSVYLRARLTEPLRVCRRLAEQRFALAESEFMPHVSLAYGGDLELRAVVAAELPSSLLRPAVADRIVLVEAGSEDPATWRSLVEEPLRGRGPARGRG